MAKILIVEDQESNREYLAAVLSRAGYDIEEAANGETAIELLHTAPADVVITDIVMEGMNGYEFVKTIREDPALKHIPVIFCSAQFRECDAQELALSVGAFGVLIKPCWPAEILGAVDRCLKSHNSEALVPLIPPERMLDETPSVLNVLLDLVARLSRSENRLRAVFDYSPLFIAIKDLNGRFLMCNRLGEQFFGRPEKELIGRTVFEHQSPHLAETHAREDRKALESGQMIESETESLHADGAHSWQTTRFPLLDCSGTPFGLGLIGRDVTAQKKAEQRLVQNAADLEENARLQAAIARLSFEGLRKTGADTLFQNAVSLVGDALQADFCRIVESTPEGGLRQAAVYGILDEPESGLRPVFLELLARHVISLRGGVTSNNLAGETRFRGPELFRGWGFSSAIGVCIDNGNRPCAVIEIFKKKPEAFRAAHAEFVQAAANIMTACIERDRAEESLRATQGYLSHLIASSPSVIYALHMKGDSIVPVTVGENITRITGYSVADVLRPEWWQEHASSDDLVRALSADGAAPDGNQLVRELCIRGADGKSIWIRDECRFLVGDRDASIEIVGSLSDITAEKALEEQLERAQRMETLGQFAGGIAHDFNNSLTVISGFTQLELEDSSLTPSGREALETIAKAAEGAIALTRQLLAFSRKSLIQFRLVDLGAAIENLTKMMRRVIGPGVELKTAIEPGLPPVNADIGMIEQVLLNLAINGRDAMPAGGYLDVRIRRHTFSHQDLASNPERRTGEMLCLEVADTGTGIAPDTLRVMFDPFFTTKEAGKGTGLGLATVQAIVARHNGWIEVESQPGAGSTFRVYLPVASGLAERRGADRKAIASASENNVTILVLEPDSLVGSFIEKFLDKQGYRTLSCCSAESAESVARSFEGGIDLFLATLFLPGPLSGPQVAARLGALRPEMKALFTTGYHAEANSATASSAEDLNLIYKPFDLNHLLDAIRKTLSRKARRSAA